MNAFFANLKRPPLFFPPSPPSFALPVSTFLASSVRNARRKERKFKSLHQVLYELVRPLFVFFFSCVVLSPSRHENRGRFGLVLLAG